MVQTITPVVHGGSRRRWAGAVALHVLGATLSASATGAVLGVAGSILGAPWGRPGMLAVAAVALAYLARELFGSRVPIPELRRQVPEWWRGAFGPRVAAFLYGVALGPGFFTHLRHGTFVAASAAVVATGDPLLGALLLAPFGLARALGVSVVSAAPTETAVMAVGARLERLGSGNVPRAANALALLALAVAAPLVTLATGTWVRWLWPSLLAGTFGWAALAKLLGRGSWRENLRAYSLPAWMEGVAERVVPLAEASVVVLLLAGSIEAGAILSLFLLAAFTVSVIRVSDTGKLPCGCFGSRRGRPVSWLLARNLAIAGVAMISLAAGTPMPIEAPGAAQALPGSLAIGGLCLAFWLIRRSTDLWNKQEIGSLGTK